MAARFPTTRWSRVIRAGDPADPGGRAALEELCRDYWLPLYTFVCRHGFSAVEAADIAQGLCRARQLSSVPRSQADDLTQARLALNRRLC